MISGVRHGGTPAGRQLLTAQAISPRVWRIARRESVTGDVQATGVLMRHDVA